MGFYFEDDFIAAGNLLREPDENEWLVSTHPDMGTALKYLLSVERWTKDYFKDDEYAVWKIDTETNEIKILFSNYKTATMFSLAGVKASDIEDK